MIQNQLCLTNTHQNIKKNGICNYELANEFAPILSNITLYQNCILSYYQNKSGHFNKIQKQNSIGNYYKLIFLLKFLFRKVQVS